MARILNKHGFDVGNAVTRPEWDPKFQLGLIVWGRNAYHIANVYYHECKLRVMHPMVSGIMAVFDLAEPDAFEKVVSFFGELYERQKASSSGSSV